MALAPPPGRRGDRHGGGAAPGGALRGRRRPAVRARHVPGAGGVGGDAGEPDPRIAGGDALGPPRDARADVREAEGRGGTPHRYARRRARRPGRRRGAGRLARRRAGRGVRRRRRTVLADAGRSRRLAWAAARGPCCRSPQTSCAAIPYASTGVVLLVFPRGHAGALPEGTGFVVPRGKAPMTACTWICSKWPDPAFGSRRWSAATWARVGDEDVLEARDDDLVDACARHLAAVLDLPERPEASSVVRWMRAMPQYEVGHVDRVARIRRSLPRGYLRRRLRLRRRRHPRLRPRGGRDGRAGPAHLAGADDTEGDGSMSRRHDLRAVSGVPGHATSSAISPPTNWPRSRRRWRTSTRHGTGASRFAARTRRSGSAPTPT